nr:neuroplastin isoform X2 [Halyomorpha halys]
MNLFALLLLLFICSVRGKEGIKVKAGYDNDNIRFLEYKSTNILKCEILELPSGSGPPSEYIWTWLKEDKVMDYGENSHYIANNNELHIQKTNEDDIRQYSCLISKKSAPKAYLARADIKTLGIPTAKILSQGTFIEGQKIILECVVQGNPTPTVEWHFGNTTFTSSIGRIKLSDSKNVQNAILQIDEAQMLDRGEYSCSAHNIATSTLNETRIVYTFVRVKDKLAALWPFIGICAEVVVLCAIIFIYERKRNKAELEESDTDQSPEQ